MGLKDINYKNIDFQKWEKENQKNKKNEMIEKNTKLKQEWIEKFGEEHWNETENLAEEITNDILKWDEEDKKD